MFRLRKAGIGAMISLLVLSGCGRGPATPDDALGISTIDSQFIAYDALVNKQGSLFLWDAAFNRSFVISGAFAGLTIKNQSDIDLIHPQAFGDGKILFGYGNNIYVWDNVAEEQVKVATDAKPGIRVEVTWNGQWLVYVNNLGQAVLKETDGVFFTKTRVLTNISDQLRALGKAGVIGDLSISGDARWLVLQIDGRLYMYDVANPHLFELPVGPTNIQQVETDFSGRFIAYTFNTGKQQKVNVLDRETGLIDVVPAANNAGVGIIDPQFTFPLSLIFQTTINKQRHIVSYDLLTQTVQDILTVPQR